LQSNFEKMWANDEFDCNQILKKCGPTMSLIAIKIRKS